MLFNSFEFLMFFLTVVGTYFLLPHRFRWVLLLAASYWFYMAWKAEYIVLILISTAVDYFCSLKMGQFQEKRKRKPFLWISLLSNLGILFTFKYFDFFSGSAAAIATSLNIEYALPALQLILPMGISFYTFQTMSYSVDVYQGKLQPEKHIGIFALFVTFFPQLVAGPIERASNLLPQFRREVSFDYARVTAGLQQMLWGYLKKALIADRVAVYVNEVYNHPDQYDGWVIVTATIFFTFQIYCDFSGYSDIAIGAARVLGFDLMKNFDTPYFSRSIGEFWRRWHISLSTWFRDYVYIPLGGNRVVKWRWYYNLMVVFLVSGLWHGANWTFVVWGGLHGFYLVMGTVTASFRKQVNEWVGLATRPFLMKSWDIGFTFLLAVFAWIFFRANSLSDAFLVIGKIVDFSSYHIDQLGLYALAESGTATAPDIFLSWTWIFLLIGLEALAPQLKLQTRPLPLRWAIYILGIVLLLFGGVFEHTEFIYFQF